METDKEDQFRKWLETTYKESLEEKVERHNHLGTTTYDAAKLPQFLWDFIDRADLLYIDGLFIETILLTSSILESVLKYKIKESSKVNPEVIDNLTFRLLIILAREKEIINDSEKNNLDVLRRKRNSLIHLDKEKIGKYAKRKYGEYFHPTILTHKIYLMDLQEEAFNDLVYLKRFLVKFYGIK